MRNALHMDSQCNAASSLSQSDGPAITGASRKNQSASILRSPK